MFLLVYIIPDFTVTDTLLLHLLLKSLHYLEKVHTHIIIVLGYIHTILTLLIFGFIERVKNWTVINL